ncbi:hypothetical protein [Clostridium sp. USBA 49]|nr:hypothetical protein [Clostridium sp. USBA 49]
MKEEIYLEIYLIYKLVCPDSFVRAFYCELNYTNIQNNIIRRGL